MLKIRFIPDKTRTIMNWLYICRPKMVPNLDTSLNFHISIAESTIDSYMSSGSPLCCDRLKGLPYELMCTLLYAFCSQINFCQCLETAFWAFLLPKFMCCIMNASRFSTYSFNILGHGLDKAKLLGLLMLSRSMDISANQC